MKLLLIAPCCDGEDVGEAWVAYQWVRRLAERHDVTLLTYHKRDRRPATDQLSGFPIIEWIEPPLLGREERLNSMLKPAYVPFYLRARHWIKQALGRGERWDLAHQLVPVSARFPCPASGLGIPVVVGPIGGSLDNVPGFDEDDNTSPWYVGLRSLDKFRMKWDPLLRRTFDGASCVIGIGPYVREILSPRHIRQFEVMSDTGIEFLPDLAVRTIPTNVVHLLFVGRIVRTKGVRDAIRALSLLKTDVPWVFDIVGEGFDRSTCEALSSDLALSDRVNFHGSVPHDKVADFYRAADIFLFPSFREPGGTVVFEAMSWALPLVVCNRGGPGRAVDGTSGVRVDPVNPAQFASDLASALGPLIEDSGLRTTLGYGARQRVLEIGLWDSKVEQLERIYATLNDLPASEESPS